MANTRRSLIAVEVCAGSIVLKNSVLVLCGNERSVTRLSRTSTMARSWNDWTVNITEICSKKLSGNFFNTIGRMLPFSDL